MKLRYSLPIMAIATIIYMSVMIVINNRFGSFTASQAVAGVSTEKTINKAYETVIISPLTKSLNTYRMTVSLNSLVQDARLDALALTRAQDMVALNYYAHTDPSGKTFANLFENYEMPKTTPSCENLLLTTDATVSSMLAEWTASPAHNRCMQGSDWTHVGVAVIAFDENTTIAVTIFATNL